ncbi:hypothetical protein [Coralloluteibacterium thermophilus]|uniref:Lipoprotein n=1 Tax=Coralloluteibacterium thermophilum TaxID=2707049 RepID=A0ABV9NI35_9GAMM
MNQPPRIRPLILAVAVCAVLAACDRGEAEPQSRSEIGTRQPTGEGAAAQAGAAMHAASAATARMRGRFEACGVIFDLPGTWAPEQDGTHWTLTDQADDSGYFRVVLECLDEAPADVTAALGSATAGEGRSAPQAQALQGQRHRYEGVRRTSPGPRGTRWHDAYYLRTAGAGAILTITSSDGAQRQTHLGFEARLTESLRTDAVP